MIKENPSKRAPNTSDCESIENHNKKHESFTHKSATHNDRHSNIQQLKNYTRIAYSMTIPQHVPHS